SSRERGTDVVGTGSGPVVMVPDRSGQSGASDGTSLRPMTAPMIPAMSRALTGEKASSPVTIAHVTVSAAPTPVQIAYPVPMGMVRTAQPSPTMLTTSAPRKTAVDVGSVKPSERPRAVAQTASKTALTRRTTHGTSAHRLEPGDAADEEDQEGDAGPRGRLGPGRHRPDDGEGGADPDPHGVRGAGRDAGHRPGQPEHARSEGDDEEEGGKGAGEAP